MKNITADEFNMADRPFAYVCSPLRGDVEANMERAREYSRQVFEAGYCAIAPHIFFTQYLRDDVPAEREAGMEMGAKLLAECNALVVCGDTVTEGMDREIALARRLNIPVYTLDALMSEHARSEPEAQAPRDMIKPEREEFDGVFRAYIVNADDMADRFMDIDRLRHGVIGGKWHTFPTTTAELQATMEEIGVDGITHKSCAVNGIDGVSEALIGALPLFSDLNELNYLALNLEDLTESQREIFEAVLESGRHCSSLTDIINLTENLDRFYLQPAYSPEQYGEFLAMMDQDEYAWAVEKLEKSIDPDLRELAGYIKKLEDHVDSVSYGRARTDKENGVYTKHGYLTEDDGFKEVYRGPEDIPAEYRLLPMPEKEPPMKVENTDLTDLLLKMHALGGDYMHDAHYNLNTLDNGNSAEYLLLMNGRNAFLSEAAHAYHHGSTAYDFWMKAEAGPDTRAFAIHSANMRNPRGCVIGDIVEIDFAERQRDILSHSIHFTRIDAVPKFGPDRSYTPEEWNGMEAIDRDMLGSWTKHFEPDDLLAVKRHLEGIREEHAGVGRVVAPDKILFNLNDSYMAKAENPRPDMLRVNMDVAKDILTRSGAPVYRLLPKGPEALSALDAMPSRGGLWYQSHREFAIKKDDFHGLDRWADRTADAMIVRWQPERAAPDKSKKHGPEL